MSILGYGSGGQAGLGPSKMFDSLPFKNWRDQVNWVEEFIDAIGLEFDIRDSRFVSASARAALLDPTHDPADDTAELTYATPTTAPTLAVSRDTMLDVLLFIALGVYPADSNLTVAQKQLLAQVGPTVLRRQANRIYLLYLISQITDGIVYGWSNPPYTFSFILPDGAPSPGWGSWVPGLSDARTGTVQVTNGSVNVVGTGTAFLTQTFVGDRFTVDRTTTYVVVSVTDDAHLTLNVVYAGVNASGLSYYGSASASSRPWLLATIRNLLQPVQGSTVTNPGLFPAWSQLGVGYSQFRAGYSAAGETVLSTGSRINIFSNEHFSSWAAGAPTGYTGTGTTQSASATYINREFTNYACVMDLTGQAAGTIYYYSPTNSDQFPVNNKLTHRFQLDYQYTNAQNESHLRLQIFNLNSDGNYYYYDPVNRTWSQAISSVHEIFLPPSSTRARYACDVIPLSGSSTATAYGMSSLGFEVRAISDGTSTTQVPYTIYRHALYEKFDLGVETEAVGERSLWLPLADAAGWTTTSRAAAGTQVIVPENSSRSAVKLVAADKVGFPYHPALSGRGYRATSTWTNLARGNLGLSAWTASNVTVTGSATISPIVGETAATASTVAATAVTGFTAADIAVIDPSNKSYVSGVWVKKTSADAHQAGTITVTAGSASVTGSGTAFSSSWANAQIRTSGGHVYTVSSVTNSTTLTLTGVASTTEAAVTFDVSDVMLTLQNGAGATYPFPYFVSQSEGWKLITATATFGAVGGSIAMKLNVGFAGNLTFGVWGGYLYDVTGKAGVLYPPACASAAATTGTVAATKCQATTNTLNADTLSPLTLRQMSSVVNGALKLTVVPTYDAASQSNGVIFDTANDATHNRVKLSIASGVLRLDRWDNSANTGHISLTLSAAPSPANGSMTWLRDSAIDVFCRWSSDGSMTMSAGGGNVSGSSIASFAAADGSSGGVGAIGVGNDYALANSFDGIVTGVEVLQVGAPVV